MSIIVVGIAYYCVYGKMKFVYILYCILAIKFAYIIINPYRIYMISNTDFEGTSLTGIIQGFIKSQENTYQTQEEETDNYAVVKRLNFIPEMTKFQEYKNERGFKEGDPDFIFYTLTTPIQLVTPRFLWKDKPKSDLGRIWVTQKVFNINYNTSTAFGPLGFLYMTGGVFAIIIGFILIGLVLKIVNLFLISDYWGGILIALALTLNVTSLEAEFNFYIITFIQTLIFAIIFQLVIFKKEINGS